ncbi:hypothetical protein GOP47_0009253 [Adiantum capillus-veneris]|uniref:Uncharacterized protein n=1 Tax=Adiantum capillus-veneris TaxID=13818 RepID=A0A9D4UXG2_ADICA|nr:hypothetical protein GOP47_0009253 [Adiantum capillus-veneris]
MNSAAFHSDVEKAIVASRLASGLIESGAQCSALGDGLELGNVEVVEQNMEAYNIIHSVRVGGVLLDNGVKNQVGRDENNDGTP